MLLLIFHILDTETVSTVKTQDLVHLPHVLVQAWAGKSQFSTGVWAELGSTHIRVLKHDANVLKH